MGARKTDREIVFRGTRRACPGMVRRWESGL